MYIQRNVYYAGLWQDVSKGVYIETDGYYGFFNLYKKLFDSGFDVKLVYRCEKCAVKERKPFVEFWFKAVGDEKYTVTSANWSNENPKTSAMFNNLSILLLASFLSAEHEYT